MTLERIDPVYKEAVLLAQDIERLKMRVDALLALTAPTAKTKKKYPPGKQPVKNPITGKIKYV